LSSFQKSTKFQYYQGAYDFVAEDRSELAFRKGEILKIINSNDVDWWKGKPILSALFGLWLCFLIVCEMEKLRKMVKLVWCQRAIYYPMRQIDAMRSNL
jgi:hypothetical protein